METFNTVNNIVRDNLKTGGRGSGIAGSEVSDKTVLYLTFNLGRDLFGISVNCIREVIEFKKVFKAPRVPDYIKGVINLRGEVVPVIDLSCRFYGTKNTILDTTSIVVVEVDDESVKIPVGVIIDRLMAVAGLDSSKIESTPEIGSTIRSDFIEGIGKNGDQFIILLQMQNILNIDELSGVD